ncbi:hypothetical protein Mycch_1407 [Mycolicibacterium chubuense NBB4]|uniref:MmpS3 protein n=1 Tax=Mycolicibacterium chubuense (strain NBB4) TaxID=710421 RepID=I4BG02_MYCCN|nr:hypothetical protein [Mycolicibacterium chubuense]AFM16209.1 hypothetical protein Mycch_1407 [Mycolicibacterium chubuense NBB4]
MNRPYTAQSPYSLTPTERMRSSRRSGRSSGRYGGRYGDDAGYEGYGTDGRYGDLDTDVYPPYPGYDEPAEDYDEAVEMYDEARIDRRWMWIAGVAGAILFVAVITASMILGGGDSGSVSATLSQDGASGEPTTTAAAAPSAAPTSAPRAAAAPPSPSLPAETVTTITPTAQTPTPAPAVPVLPAPQAAPPAPAAAPGTITYHITGNKQLIDFVTVIYTDQRGALQTEMNVSLPWSKTVVLDPGVTLSSVTATSVGGQLNCSISDANGAVIAAQNSNSMITNCTR